jgi:two-component sensor histidine kinase/Flp pilus assembly protein TadD
MIQAYFNLVRMITSFGQCLTLLMVVCSALLASVDSTAQTIPHSESNLSCNSHLDSCFSYLNSEPEKTVELAALMLNSSDVTDELCIKWAQYYLGSAYRLLGDIEEAQKVIQSANENYLATNPLKARLCNEMGIILKQQSQFNLALNYFNEASIIYRDLEDLESQAKIYNNIGRIHFALEDYSEALFFYQKAHKIKLTGNSKRTLAISYHNIGSVKEQLENDSAYFFYNKAYELYVGIGDEVLIAYGACAIGAVSEDFSEAEKMLKESISIRKGLGLKADLIESYRVFGEVYLKQDNYQDAESYLDSALALSQASSHQNAHKEVIKLLIDLKIKTENYKEAIGFQTEYIALMDSIRKVDKFNTLQEFRALLDYYEQQTEIETLREDKEIAHTNLSNTEDELASEKRQVAVSIITIILISALAIALILLILRQKRINTKLNEQKSIIEANNREKELLVREIHHRVKNNLQIIMSLVRIEKRSMDKNDPSKALDNIVQRIDAMSSVHEYLHQQTDMQRIDLGQYLKTLIDNQLSSLGLQETIKFESQFSIENVHADNAVLYGQLLSELIMNSAKHAFSDGEQGIISIQVLDQGEYISLVYKDNGMNEFLNNVSSGTSFGQNLIQSIIKKMNGEIQTYQLTETGYHLNVQFRK